MKTLLTFIMALLPLMAFAQAPPVLRNEFTTNTMMNAVQDGWFPVWNNVARKWSNTLIAASATNAQPPATWLTNISITGAVTNLNDNQFAGDLTIASIKSGALLTNITIYESLSQLGLSTFSDTATFNSSVIVNDTTILNSGLIAQDAVFNGDVVVPPESYGVPWDGSLEVPTKNAIYDKIESLTAGGAFNANQFEASSTFTNIKSRPLITNIFNHGALVVTNDGATAGSIDVDTGTAGQRYLIDPAVGSINYYGSSAYLGLASVPYFIYTENFASVPTNMGVGGTNDVRWHKFSSGPNSSMLRTDADGVVRSATIGAGLSFDGTTLSGGGVPGGDSGAVQFNEGDVFAGTNRFEYDRTNEYIRLTGSGAQSGTLRIYPNKIFLEGNGTLMLGNGGHTNWGIDASGNWSPHAGNVQDIGTFNLPSRTNWTMFTVSSNGIRIPTNASSGRVLTSDADGNATWQNPSSGGSGLFNTDQFAASATHTNIKSGALMTNISVLHATNRGAHSFLLNQLTQMGTNMFADGTNATVFTNVFNANSTGTGLTNLYVTNIMDGQIITLWLFPSNGVTIGFPQFAAADYTDGAVIAPTTNQWNHVQITKRGSLTNILVNSATYQIDWGNITPTTNFATKTITLSAPSTSLITNVNSLLLTNQIRLLPAHFNGSNGVTPVALTNLLDTSLATFKAVTNRVGTNWTGTLTNLTLGASGVMVFEGLPNMTNTITFIAASAGTNIQWMNWETNGNYDILCRGGYTYKVEWLVERQTNVVIDVSANDPFVPITDLYIKGTNYVANTTVSNNISYITALLSGNGNGSSNYALSATMGDRYINGAVNVHIASITNTTRGLPTVFTLVVTNGSGGNTGINFSSGTNSWRWSYSQGAAAPSVLTNLTQLLISGRVDGSNVLASYAYFAWP